MDCAERGIDRYATNDCRRWLRRMVPEQVGLNNERARNKNRK